MRDRKQKECKHHGFIDFVIDTRGQYKCTKCRCEAVTKNRQQRKKKLVQYFGGKCEICGYNKCQHALQFHHIEPKNKSFAISAKGICRSWEKMLEEAKKCILVCANCHFEIEHNIIEVPKELSNRVANG